MSRGFLDEDMRPTEYDVRDPRVQVLWFKERMTDMKRDQPERYAKLIEPLRGRNLACWCRPGDPCHGDVLLELSAA